VTFNGYSPTNQIDSLKHNYPFSLASFTVYGSIGPSSQIITAIEVARNKLEILIIDDFL